MEISMLCPGFVIHGRYRGSIRSPERLCPGEAVEILRDYLWDRYQMASRWRWWSTEIEVCQKVDSTAFLVVSVAEFLAGDRLEERLCQFADRLMEREEIDWLRANAV